MSSTYVRFKQLKCEAFLLKRDAGHIVVFVAIHLKFLKLKAFGERNFYFLIYTLKAKEIKII